MGIMRQVDFVNACRCNFLQKCMCQKLRLRSDGVVMSSFVIACKCIFLQKGYWRKLGLRAEITRQVVFDDTSGCKFRTKVFGGIAARRRKNTR